MASVTKSDSRRKFPVDVIVCVILSKVERVLCVPSSLTFGNFTFCPQSVLMFHLYPGTALTD